MTSPSVVDQLRATFAQSPPAVDSVIPIRTLFECLIGRRKAILEIASTPAALGAGALLVLSAGLARNFDKAELFREPWRLLGPFGASLFTSGLLFVVVYGIATHRHMAGADVFRAYGSFLAIYWTTASLAWLYGIPYEWMLYHIDATRANLWTLGVVSIWRVALMVRVVSIFFGVRALAVFPVVMLVEDVFAWGAIAFSPVPLIQTMGGTNESIMVSDLAIQVLIATTASFPVWLIAGIWAATRWRPVWSVPDSQPARRATRILLFAGLCVAVWGIAAIAVSWPHSV